MSFNYNRTRSGFLGGLIAALVLGFAANVYAQSPLTVQPSTGRVGVGTSAPAAKLEAKGTDVGISVMNNAGTQNYYFGIKDSDGSKLYIGKGRDPSQGLAPAVTILPSDNVGIGTTNPLARLEAKGTDVGIGVMNNAGTQNYYFGIKDSDSNKLYIGAGKDPSQGITPAMVVTSGAKVGIGTTGPNVNFQVGSVATTLGDSSTWPVWISSGSSSDRIMFASSGTGASQFGVIASASSSSWTNTIINPNGGNVGVGTTSPNYLLHVNGSAGKPGGGSWSNASDVRLKTNIGDLQGVLDQLLRLHGVSFEYKDPASVNELAGEQIGMIAQEVEKVFPQWVEEGADGYKRVTYRGFEALTVEALRQLRQEKDAQIADIRGETKELRQELARLKSEMEKLSGRVRFADFTGTTR